jgi:hypothetical protein
MRRRWVRLALGSIVAFVALTGLAHTSYGLRAIAWVTGSDGCPFGGGKQPLTAQRAEELRLARVARGESTAPARPALGFALDKDHRADVLAWAARHGVSCSEDKSHAGLRCVDVPGDALPAPVAIRGVVMFGFAPDDRLVSVQHQSASATPRPEVAAVAGRAMAELEPLGRTQTIGDALDAERFVHRRTSLAFADYRADVVASNLGKRWTVIQTYQSIH